MPQRLFSFVFVLFCVWSDGVLAADNDRIAAIRSLGALNGVALHCGALEETQRIKRALVSNLPKRRQLGELFEHETNASFMKFIEDGAACPSKAALADKVDEAIAELEVAYARK